MPTTYSLIAQSILTATTTSVTFSSIPATYTDLLLKISARSGDGGVAQQLVVQFNSITSNDYSSLRVSGNSDTVRSVRNSDTYFYNDYTVPGTGSLSSTFSNHEIYIPNYTSTAAYRTLSIDGVQETNSSGAYEANITSGAHLWNFSSAVSSIKLGVYDFSGIVSFVSGSSFYLYGIKKS